MGRGRGERGVPGPRQGIEGPATIEDVAGSYSAIVFETTADGSTTDQLAAGASISLVLAADGTTTGQLFVPGGAEDGRDFVTDLAGTWSLSDSEVTLDHPADTFLRDMTFSYSDGTLSGTAAFSGVQIAVVLRRQ